MVGNEKNILIGKDPIIGSSASPYLQHDLIEYRNDYGIYTLQDACNPSVEALSC